MNKLKCTGLILLVGTAATSCLSASVLATVGGAANVFSAGQGGGTAVDPIAQAGVQGVVFTAGNLLQFTGPGIAIGSAITGSTTPCVSTCGSAGPDGADLGAQLPATNITSGNTLSGIQFSGREMFLVGVFLGASVPGSLVATLPDYATGGNSTLASYSPLIGQAFFIGDGLTGTGSGSVQNFVIPTGTTRLFLGFADAFNFNGAAGMYTDNSGTVTVNLQLVAPAAVPEPGTMALFALGLAGLALGRKKFVA